MPYLVWITQDGMLADRWELKPRVMLAGRGANCDIRLTDERASRQHFEIGYDDGRYYVTDLKSANGTTVNGLNLGDQKRYLSPGDRIRVGAMTLVFELDKPKGLATVINELEKKSQDTGKGFKTMMREITKSKTAP